MPQPHCGKLPHVLLRTARNEFQKEPLALRERRLDKARICATRPGRYAFYGAEGALTLTPLPEAYEGYEFTKAVIDLYMSAAHLAWDVAQ